MQYHSVLANQGFRTQTETIKEAQLALLGRLLAAGGRGLGRVAARGGGAVARGAGRLGGAMQRGGYRMVESSPLRRAMQAVGQRTGLRLTSAMPTGLGRDLAMRQMAARGAFPAIVPRSSMRTLEAPPTVSHAALMGAGSPAPQVRVPSEVLARAGSPMAPPIVPTAAPMRDLFTGNPRLLGSAHPLNVPNELTGAMSRTGPMIGPQTQGRLHNLFPPSTLSQSVPGMSRAASYDRMIEKAAFLDYLVSRMAS